MFFVGELTIDFATYRRIVTAGGGAGIWVFRALGLTLVLCAGSVLVTDGTPLDAVFVVLGLLVLFFRELVVALGWNQVRRLTARPWRYEITAGTVGIHTPETSVSVAWSGISRTRIRRHAWVFTIAATRRSMVVPRAAFSPEDQREIDIFLGGDSDEAGHG